MKRAARVLLIGLAVLAGTIAIVLTVLHLPPVQRWAWEKASTAIADATGWDVTADDIGLNLFAGTLEAEGVTAATEGRTVATIADLRAEFDISTLLGAPRRIDSLRLEDVEADLRNLPAGPKEEEPQPIDGDPLAGFEIGDLQVVDARLDAAVEAAEVEVSARDIDLAGSLEDGLAEAELTAGPVLARRQGRELRLGSLALEASGNLESIDISRLEASGPSVEASLSAEVDLDPAVSLDADDIRIAAGLEEVLEWWDPALEEQLDPVGRAVVEGSLGYDDAGLDADLEHVGEPIRLAGYRIDELSLTASDGAFDVSLSGPNWGGADVRLAQDRLQIRADLDRTDLEPVLRRLPEGATERVPERLTLSGTFDLDLPMPPDLEDLASIRGTADLQASWPAGTLDLEARGTAERVRLETLELDVEGGRLTGGGTVTSAGRLGLDLALEAAEPARVLASLEPFLPEMPELEVSGGPLTADLTVEGPATAPRIDADLVWQEPSVMGYSGDRLEASLEGDLDRLDYAVELALVGDIDLVAEGSVRPGEPHVHGTWRLEPSRLRELLALAPQELPFEEVEGTAQAEGAFQWAPDGWSAAVNLLLDDPVLDEWEVDVVRLDVDANPERVQVDRLRVEWGEAVLQASGTFGLEGMDAPVEAVLRLDDLRLETLPVAVPEELHGVAGLDLAVTGIVAEPEGELIVSWRPRSGDEAAVLDPIRLQAELDDGVLRISDQELATAAGRFQVDGRAPLGALPLPEWLWQGAPEGPVTASLAAEGLRSKPLLALVGMGDLPLDATTDLDLELRWDLDDPLERRVELRLPNLRIDTGVEVLTPAGVPSAVLDGNRLVVRELSLSGEYSDIDVAGSVDLAGESIDLSADLELHPNVMRLIPMPLYSTGPFEVDATLQGPFDDLSGELLLDQGDGQLVMRDPPLEITDLLLGLSLEDGVISVSEGQANVNQGTVFVGGEWNPETGQGVVFEVEDVAFMLPYGILTRWGGLVALEPVDERLMRVAGDLTLEEGLWERPVDIAGLVLDRDVSPESDNETMYDILLDLEVRGRGGVAVDNNLGNFEVTWATMFVGGNAAEPVLEGELRIVAGGTIALSGRPLQVQRGSIVFPGEPGAEPQIEIIPDNPFAFGGGGDGVDAEALARQGIATGLTRTFGLSTTAARKADIELETENDPTRRFSVAQQFGRYVAIFLSTDLSEVQDRTALVQVYNIPEVPGLALQAFNETDGGDGYAVIERFRWGGDEATLERPLIRRITLDGDWPISKRKLKRAVELDKGQPYDPFLPFVGRVRLERRLAKEGYYRPRVDTRVSDDPRLPHIYFAADPGPHQKFEFRGDDLTKSLKREVRAMYQAPPLQGASFEEMRSTIRRHLDARNHPFNEVEVSSENEVVVVEVNEGPEVELVGPAIDGLPEEARSTVVRALGTPSELAALIRNPDRTVQRVERLLALEGFRDARVLGQELEDVDKETKRLVVGVRLGPRATLDQYRIDGRDPLAAADLADLHLERGMPLRQRVVDRAARTVRREYRETGYVDVAVRTRVEETEDEEWRVVMELDPGRQHRVGGVEVEGLDYISRSMIDEGVVLREGDLLRPSEVDRSLMNLAGFAPIERVDIGREPLGPETTRLVVDVTEKARWSAGVGVKWVSDIGTTYLADIRDDGLFGRGFSLNLRGRWSEDDRLALLIGSLPAKPGGHFSGLFSLDYAQRPDPNEPETQREEEIGGSLEGTYQWTDTTLLRAYYQYSETEIRCTVDDFFLCLGLPETIRTGTLGTQGIYDRLDDPLNPRHGYALTLDIGWSSTVLAGDFDTLRALLRGTTAVEPWERWTWAQAVRIGDARPLRGTEELNSQTRFFAGGEGSIRGFRRDYVGPLRIGSGGDLVPAGGGALLILNEELRIPVWRAIRAAVFADIGQVWEDWGAADSNLAVGAGVGVRWATPFGPLWADVAWPVAEAGPSTGPKYYIGIGRPF